LLLDIGQLGLERFNGVALGDEVTGDQNWRGNQIGFEAALAFV
jgi:hypothetical protein